MRPAEAAKRSREWLEEQLEQLRDLRNANPRDPGFKLWRQSTLTVIQRIWAGDDRRLERFRSIRFHAPGGRNDRKTTREWYERGCADATQFMRTLIEDIDANGVPDPRQVERLEAAPAGAEETDFPTVDLDLSEGPADRSTSAIPESTDIVLDLGGPAGESGDASQARNRDAGSPAPPTLRVDVPKSGGRAGAQPRAKSANGRSKPAKKATPKQRLRDMLGLDALDSSKAEPAPRAPEPERPSSGAPRAQEPDRPPGGAQDAPAAKPEAGHPSGDAQEPQKPAAAGKRRPKRMVSIESLISPEFRVPHPPAEAAPAPPPPVAQAPAPPLVDDASPEVAAPPVSPAPMAPKTPVVPLMDIVAIGEEISAVPVPEPEPQPPPAFQAPATPVAPPAVVAPIEPVVLAFHPSTPPPPLPAPPEPEPDEVHDPATLEQVTRDFISNSPIFAIQAKPVQRTSDATVHQHPDAIALATLANDLGRLGIPEGRRAGVRATLVDLARRLDTADVDWPVLRDATTFALDYPELAKRLLPILLPWFERAA